jgi:glutaredoxin
MNNKIAIILITGALAAPSLTQGQSNQRGQSQSNQRGQGQQQHGAPNSVRSQSGPGSSINRQSVRQPLSSTNSGQQGNSGQTQKPSQGGGNSGRKPQSGMTQIEIGGEQNGGEQNGGQQRQRVNIKETLDLTDEQAAQLKAIHEKWHKHAKAIHGNKELSKEEKKAKLKEGFKKMDAAVRELLSEEQYAKLKKLRQSSARPNQNGNSENGQQNGNGNSNSQHRQRLIKELELTEEQVKKLRAVDQYATRKIKGIIANKELSKEEKKEQIKAVHQQAHNRRMEIFTEEQIIKLQKIRAHIREQRQQQEQNGGGNSSGRPQSHQQGNGTKPSQEGGSGLGATHNKPHSKVVLYCIPSCGYCTKAADLLKSKGVDFVRKNIHTDQKARAVVAKKTKDAGIQWRGGVPVIIAGDKIIVGFNKTALNQLK